MITPTPERQFNLNHARHNSLSRTQEQDLFQRVRTGDRQAREAVICANLRFVRRIALGYRNRGVALDDLIMEGTEGLIRSVDSYEYERGLKFNTYAVWWIRQRILIALAEQGRIVNLPPRLLSFAKQVERVRKMLDQKLGRFASETEIGEALGLTPERFQESFNALHRSASIDHHHTEGETEFQMSEFLLSDGDATDLKAAARMRRAGIRHLLASLSPQERWIITGYFGLKGYTVTLQDMADQSGVSRERIRQIKDKALAKLKKRRTSLEITL